jgi:hypothetical protein
VGIIDGLVGGLAQENSRVWVWTRAAKAAEDSALYPRLSVFRK